MKAKVKPHKLLSLLLALALVVTLLPGMGMTALAAGIPDPTFVSVDGGKGFASPSKLYYKNGDTEDNFSGDDTSYNAAYDPATGTLTLNDYDGGRISLGGAAADHLTIKLIGHNTVTVNGYEDVGIGANGSGSNITITADSSGSTLAINVTADSKTVAGINNDFVDSATSGNVTIKGYADVTITATTNATNKSCYGIYADDVVIKDHAKVAITVNAPSKTGGPIYGIFAKTNVTIDTDGEITVDASNAGTTDRVYSTGNNSKNTLTLTKVGKMTVKWKDKTFGAPLYPGVEFDSTAYDNIVDTTNCVATYMPKGTTPTTYTVSFNANGGSGTMADVTDISGEYTLPENGFTAPGGKQFKAWSVGGVEKAVGDKITVTANTTVTAVWEDIPVVNYTVSGSATSFGSDTDNVILQLIAEGFSEADYEVFVKGNTAEYSIEGVSPGTYTMKVSKKNHVTREYTVTVGAENVTQDVEIWLLGDVNGDGTINVKDKKLIFNHLNDPSGALTGYALDVGDVNRDGTINVKDKKLIFNHLKGTSLWS